MSDDVRECAACRSPLPAGARFCPACGAPVGEGTVAYTSTEPRLFGVVSPLALLVAAGILLAGGLVALITGNWPLAVVLLALAAALVVLFFGTDERETTSSVARGVLTTRDRVWGWVRFAGDTGSAWTRAGRGVARLAPELRHLRRERAQVQLVLGDAAYREDAELMGALRARMRELDDAIAEREAARAELLDRARRRVADERLAIRPTEIKRPEEGPPGDESSSPPGG